VTGEGISRFLSPDYEVNLLKDREIFDFDNNSLPSVREILTGPKQKEVIDFTADDDDGNEKDIIKVSGLRDRLNIL
jgi:hypothetical protein